jgi:hypothetical protein
MGGPAPGRGRRPEPGPTAAVGGRPETVVAWLLRVNRIYGPDEQFAVASRFTKALASGPRGLSVSESQVSRWERAAAALPPGAVHRYEQLLDLADGRIMAMAHTVYRESAGRVGPPLVRDRPEDGERIRRRLAELIDRALGTDVMTGADWDALTAALWDIPVLLHPPDLWNRLADRLLAELLIAEGPAWLYRCEAIHRILGHRDGTAAVIAACAGVIADARSQILIEPMSLFELTPDRVAARYLLDQIRDPQTEHARRAAWWSVSEKVGLGHFTPAEVQTLIQAATQTLLDASSPVGVRLSAAETLRQVLPSVPADTRRVLNRLARNDPAIGSVMLLGTTSAGHTVHAVARRLSDGALTGVRRDVLHFDPMLEQLVGDLLFHPQGTRRVLAGQAVAATPYRTALAAAIGRELVRPGTLADPVLGTALVQALTHVGGPDEAGLVQRLALDQRQPAAIRDAAAWVVGHVPGTESASFWISAEQQINRRPPTARAEGLVYSLGTASLRRPARRADLARLAADPGLDSQLRRAAAWWLAIPDPIRRSVLA